MSGFSNYTTKDISGYSKTIFDLKFNKEGNYISYISSDKQIKIGQLETNGQYQNIHNIPNTNQMTQTCWNPSNDSNLAICSDDKYIELWDVRAARASSKILGLGNHINMSWSPCGNYIAIGNKSDILTVLDIRTSTSYKKKKFQYEVNEIAWTYNSDYLLTATGGEGVGAIDIIKFDNEELHVLDTLSGHVSNCCNLKIDPNFQKLAVGSLDSYVSIWDLDDMICKYTVGMDSEIRNLSFNGDGNFLAIIADDPYIVICDTNSGESITKIQCRYKMSSLSWHPKQNLIAVACEDKSPVPQYVKFYSFS